MSISLNTVNAFEEISTVIYFTFFWHNTVYFSLVISVLCFSAVWPASFNLQGGC